MTVPQQPRVANSTKHSHCLVVGWRRRVLLLLSKTSIIPQRLMVRVSDGPWRRATNEWRGSAGGRSLLNFQDLRFEIVDFRRKNSNYPFCYSNPQNSLLEVHNAKGSVPKSSMTAATRVCFAPSRYDLKTQEVHTSTRPPSKQESSSLPLFPR